MDFQAKRLLSVVAPIFEGQAVAAFDTYASLLLYGDILDSSAGAHFVVLRRDYDRLLPLLEEACARSQFIFDGYLGDCPSGTPVHKPYLQMAERPGGFVVSLYPIDELPQQITLRLRVMRKALRINEAYSRAIEMGDEEGARRAVGRAVSLQRFSSANDDEKVYVAYGAHCISGPMGERAIFKTAIPHAKLFPPKELSCEGVTFSLPNAMSNWAVPEDEQHAQLFEVVQRELLSGLKEIDRVSSLTKTSYFLASGTLLGAVRHQGFIPWDDDADVGMVRKDYERFISEAPDFLGEEYILQVPTWDSRNRFTFSRLYKKGLQYITSYNEDKPFEKGLWIDIFPFDLAPRNEHIAALQGKLANGLARISMGLRRRQEYVRSDLKLPTERLSRGDLVYLKLSSLVARMYPVTLTHILYSLVARAFNHRLKVPEDLNYSSFFQEHTTIRSRDLFPLKWVPFEGEKFSTPGNPVPYLQELYGDYRRVPSPAERKNLHGAKYVQLENGKRIYW